MSALVRLVAVLLLLVVSCSKSAPAGPTVATPPTKQAPSDISPPVNYPETVLVDATEYEVTSGAVPGYVSDETCSSCHSEIAESYQSMGMARSFYPPDEAQAIEDFENNHYYHAPSKRHYEMRIENGQYFQRRYRVDENGKRYAVRDQKIDWICGSGNHARTYFYQTELGEMFQLPVSWYSQDREWRMSPGYEGPVHEGFGRRVKHECMFCHNGMPELPKGADEYSRLSIFPKEMPHGVGCQRCHGPGSEHVALASDGNTSEEAVRAAIVNPGKLSQKLREDVCYQCHLQPTSAKNSFVRVGGRGSYSFRPGEPLEAHMRHLDFGSTEDREGRFQINHHPYRMRQSKCYTESGGKLECLSCHDPHRKISESERASHYRKKCLSCHGNDDCSVEDDASMAGDCTQCHMPTRIPEDVIEVKMTDHLIRRDPAPAKWTEPLTRGAKPVYQTVDEYDRGEKNPDTDLYAAMALMQKGSGPLAPLRRILENNPPGFIEPHVMLGMEFIRREDYTSAIDTYAKVIADDPSLPIAVINTGSALAQKGKLDEGIRVLEGALEDFPEHPLLHLNLGSLLFEKRAWARAGKHLQKAVTLRPTLAAGHQRLGDVLVQLKQREQAVRAYSMAISADPDLQEPYLHLGELLPPLGRLDEAIRWLRRLIALNPNHAKAHRSLAWACVAKSVRSTEYRQYAVEHGLRAVELAPTDLISVTRLPFYHWLNLEIDEAEQALQVARKAGGDPPSCDLMQCLIMIRQGRGEEARPLYYDARRAAKETPPTRLRAILLKHTARLYAVKVKIIDE